MLFKSIMEKYNPINAVRIKKMRNRLKNKNITIFSSNCLGGLLYHELGLRFQSPTVNIRFSSKDFVKFIVDIDRYLSADFVEMTNTESVYPVAMLDDIIVHFVHYKTFDEAVVKWNERKKRINWDNVYIILNDCDGVTEEDLKLLDNSKFEHIICFTSKKYFDNRCSFYLEKYEGQKSIGNIMKKNYLTGELEIERYFNFVSWFNTKNNTCIDNFRKRGKTK